MTKKHLLTILFIVLSAIIMVSCSNTQAVVSEKSTTTLPSAESTSVTESTTVNTTVQKTDNTSAESSISQATKLRIPKQRKRVPISRLHQIPRLIKRYKTLQKPLPQLQK